MFFKNKNADLQCIDQIVTALKRLNRMPQFCDFSRIGPLHSVSLYSDNDTSALIRENVFCGMHLNKETALLKALVERVERLAMDDGHSLRRLSCMTERSDGLAAFPLKGRGRDGFNVAKRNAYAEAVERYVWATWWDNVEVGTQMFCDSEIELNDDSRFLVSEIERLVPVTRKIMIKPRFISDTKISIFYFELENGGLVSGGACGDESASVNLRALGELARHAACANKILAGAFPETFYERRLAYMVSTKSSRALRARVRDSGASVLTLPALSIDEVVPHRLSNHVAVHRCYFKGQPAFVGGNLERLCL